MCNIADHGMHQRWKQPVAYFLSNESTTTEMLVQFLNEVLGACQNIGLHVVATVCDMGTNSVKAMNHKKVILPVSNSSSCNNIRPSTPP